MFSRCDWWGVDMRLGYIVAIGIALCLALVGEPAYANETEITGDFVPVALGVEGDVGGDAVQPAPQGVGTENDGEQGAAAGQEGTSPVAPSDSQTEPADDAAAGSSDQTAELPIIAPGGDAAEPVAVDETELIDETEQADVDDEADWADVADGPEQADVSGEASEADASGQAPDSTEDLPVVPIAVAAGVVVGVVAGIVVWRRRQR